jgi:WD40 repeat protein
MKRLCFHLSLALAFLLCGFTSLQAQPAARCRAQPPVPKNAKPGAVGLNLSRDEKTLVVASSDGRIRIWNLATGQVERTFGDHTNSIYKAVLNPTETLVASASRDQTARIWDLATGKQLFKFDPFKCSVKSVAFSPDGKTLAAVGNDGMLKLWDVKTGKELKSLVHSDSTEVDVSVYSVVYSRDGRRIYTGNGDGTISEWDTVSGKETSSWKAHKGNVFQLVFSRDYKILASSSESEANLKLWDIKQRREIRTFGEKKTEGLIEQLHPLALSLNGTMIAAGFIGVDEKTGSYSYHRIIVWNAKTGEKLFTLEGHKLDIFGLVFTRNNRFLISSGFDMTIRFWDMKTGKETRRLTQPQANPTN